MLIRKYSPIGVGTQGRGLKSQRWDINLIFPQQAILSPMIIITPFTPGTFLENSIPFLMSSSFLTMLPTAVAQASARVAVSVMTVAASVFPKLNEGPTFAEEVHIPRGVSSGSISKTILFLNFDLSPHQIPIFFGLTILRKISPPFSIIISVESRLFHKINL
jgi:hypothetical protein